MSGFSLQELAIKPDSSYQKTIFYYFMMRNQMRRLILTICIALLSISPALAGPDGTTTIKESVEAAVKHHPQIKALLHNRDAVSNDLSSALGRFFPSLDLAVNYGLQNYDSRATRADNKDGDTNTASDSTLTLTQNVFDGMNRYNDYQGSKNRLESAEHRLYDNVENIALDAIRAHIDIVRERKLVALAGENITDHQEVLDSIAERVAGGAGNKADEMQARGRVARAETTLISYMGNLRIAEAEYRRVTGLDAGPLQDSGFKMDAIPASMDTIMNEALENNPKVKAIKADVAATERDKGVVTAAYMPTVNIELSSRYTDDLDGSETYLNDNRAMLALNWNLFNGTSDYYNRQSADDRIKETKANLQNTVEDLSRQVATAWTEYQTAVQSIQKHQEALQYSMESRDMYLMQFNVGQRSLLDVLDSINEVFSNSVLLETAMSNREFSLYRFLTLEGRLIKALEVNQAAYDPEAQ